MSAAVVYAIERATSGALRAGVVEHQDDHLSLIAWDGEDGVSWYHVDPTDRSLIVLRPRGQGVRVTSGGALRDAGVILGWDELTGRPCVRWDRGVIRFHQPTELVVLDGVSS